MSQSAEELPMETDVQTVKSWLDSGRDFLLIDCREQDEYETAHIEGAKLMPMSDLQDTIERIAKHRNKHIVVHCHHGGRSMRVATWMRQLGFESTQSMAGGIDAWSLQIDNAVPRY